MTGRSLLLACVLLSVTGCGSAPPVPEDHYYRLVRARDIHVRSWPFNRPVRVLMPEADSLYHGRALLYARQDSPLELRRYHYRFWTAPPPRLLARLTREMLGGHAAESSAAALELALRLRHFEAELGRPSRARIGITAVLRDPRRGCVVLMRDYDYRVSAEGRGHYALVQAFQRAMDRYLVDLAGDLSRSSGMCAPTTAAVGR